MSQHNYPPGWDEERVRQVLAHYEKQTEDEQFAEIEAARAGLEGVDAVGSLPRDVEHVAPEHRLHRDRARPRAPIIELVGT